MIGEAARAGADVDCLDLEDVIAPEERAAARAKVVSAFTTLDWGHAAKAVRINDMRTPWAHSDISDIVTGASTATDIIVIPKVTGPHDVWWVDTLPTQLEARHTRSRPVGLEAIIEDPTGLTQADAFAVSSARLEALDFGAGDLAASHGAQVDANLDPIQDAGIELWDYAANRVLLTARATSIGAVDPVYPTTAISTAIAVPPLAPTSVATTARPPSTRPSRHRQRRVHPRRRRPNAPARRSRSTKQRSPKDAQ